MNNGARDILPSGGDNIAGRVEEFVRTVVIPYETDVRCKGHGPAESLVKELRNKARDAGLLTPHIHSGGRHRSNIETVSILRAAGLSPLGPVALNVAAPDEGNMNLLAKVATTEQKDRFLKPLIAGERSAFFMTEPASENGAGSDPGLMKSTAHLDDGEWVIHGRKAFITGVDGAKVGIVMAKTDRGDGRMAATMFLLDLPNPAIRIERVLDTIDSSMPGGHAVVVIDGLRVSGDHILGAPHEGFKYAQVRLAPARLTHCMRWLGACIRAQEIATDYACRRIAFGKQLIEHEGVGFMLAENLIDIRQSQLMIDWVAHALDSGMSASAESSMAKVAVSEALFRIADKCVQVMGAQGLSGDTVVEQVFREVRAFRIYDGPTEVHKWSLAKKILRDWKSSQ